MAVGSTVSIMVMRTVAMFAMMAIGIILFKTRYVTNEGARQLANVALYVAGPAVIIQSLATDFDVQKLYGGLACSLLTAAFTMLGALVAWLFYRDRQRISQLGIMISNMGFMGIPLVQSVLGDEYVFYISACIAAQIPFMWTYGVWLASSGTAKLEVRRILTNPAVVSVLVGIVLFALSVNLEGVALLTAHDLGSLNTGLAMLVLGCYLAQTDIRSLLRNANLYASVALRLLAIPIIVIAILAVLPLDLPVKITLLIAFSAPCGTSTAMFSQMFGGDYRYGAGLVSVSTLLSLVLMPVMLGIGLVVF